MADKQKGETATVLMAEARASLVSGDLRRRRWKAPPGHSARARIIGGLPFLG